MVRTEDLGARLTSIPQTQLFALIRDFDGFTRLQGPLGASGRRLLAVSLAERLMDASIAAGLATTVVTADPEVSRWCADRSIRVLVDPSRGLDAAAGVAVGSAAGARWMIAHADLPLVSPEALSIVAQRPATVLVPSLDGGTNVISGSGGFPFSYGPGSFHRHLSSAPDANVLPLRDLSIDIDTPRQLEALRRLVPTLAVT